MSPLDVFTDLWGFPKDGKHLAALPLLRSSRIPLLLRGHCYPQDALPSEIRLSAGRQRGQTHEQNGRGSNCSSPGRNLVLIPVSAISSKGCSRLPVAALNSHRLPACSL